MLTSVDVYSQNSAAPALSLGSDPNTDAIFIRNVTGLDPVKAEFATKAYGSDDGEYLTGSRTGKRNIVFTLGYGILGNPQIDKTIYGLRQEVYAHFMPQQEVRLIFHAQVLGETPRPDVEISGLVESCEPNIFSQDPEIQVSILCLESEFVAVQWSYLSGVAEQNSDWTSFLYEGTVSAPITIAVTGEDNEEIYDGLVLFEIIEMEYVPLPTPVLEPGPVEKFDVTGACGPTTQVYLDSERGKKRVITYDTDSGYQESLLGTIGEGSVWPVLKPGYNRFRVRLEAPGVELDWDLVYKNRYGGL